MIFHSLLTPRRKRSRRHDDTHVVRRFDCRNDRRLRCLLGRAGLLGSGRVGAAGAAMTTLSAYLSNWPPALFWAVAIAMWLGYRVVGWIAPNPRFNPFGDGPEPDAIDRAGRGCIDLALRLCIGGAFVIAALVTVTY